MARPKIDIDADLVFKFAQLGCTGEEIANYFGCSHDTIERRFASEIAKGRSELRMSLRQMQLKAAKGGNIAMLIWLGKQMLKQTERTQIDLNKLPESVLIEEVQRRLNESQSKDI